MNRLPIWARNVEVFGNRVTATSLDRLLNLYLHHFGLRGQQEKHLFERYVRPGMRVLDIGANQGVYSMLFSRMVGNEGRVHAFEPDPSLFASLRRNCESNGLGNITLHNVGLGDVAGTLKLYLSRINSGDNRLAQSKHPAWFDEVEVRVAPLDELLQGEQVDFIKIDVQGWEFRVFQGMERLLRDNRRTVIYLEYWPMGLTSAGCKPQDCLHHLTSRGFALHFACGSHMRPIGNFDDLTRKLHGQRFTNLIALRRDQDF